MYYSECMYDMQNDAVFLRHNKPHIKEAPTSCHRGESFGGPFDLIWLPWKQTTSLRIPLFYHSSIVFRVVTELTPKHLDAVHYLTLEEIILIRKKYLKKSILNFAKSLRKLPRSERHQIARS